MDRELYLKIGKPQNVCIRCNAPIAEAGKHASALLEPGSQYITTPPTEDGPVRQDYCTDCWRELAADNFVSFWLARRDPPKPRKIQNRKERNAVLVSYFETLKGKSDTESCQTQFVLAHLLMKYGVFKWVRSETAAAEHEERIFFRNAVSEEIVQIESVELEDFQIARIKHDIDHYLSMGLPVPPENADAAPAPA